MIRKKYPIVVQIGWIREGGKVVWEAPIEAGRMRQELEGKTFEFIITKKKHIIPPFTSDVYSTFMDGRPFLRVLTTDGEIFIPVRDKLGEWTEKEYELIEPMTGMKRKIKVTEPVNPALEPITFPAKNWRQWYADKLDMNYRRHLKKGFFDKYGNVLILFVVGMILVILLSVFLNQVTNIISVSEKIANGLRDTANKLAQSNEQVASILNQLVKQGEIKPPVTPQPPPT